MNTETSKICKDELKETLCSSIKNTRNTIYIVARKLSNIDNETILLVKKYITCLINISSLQREYLSKIDLLFTVDSTECCNLYLLKDITDKFTSQVSNCNLLLLKSYNNDLNNITYSMCSQYMNTVCKLYIKYIKYLDTQFSCININNKQSKEDM